MDDETLDKKVEDEQEEKHGSNKDTAQEKYNLKSFLTSSLRRNSYRWGPRSQCLRNARVARGLYQCNICKESFKQKDIKIDHIVPVVSIKEGFQKLPDGRWDWNPFIYALFCPIEGLQAICNVCHDSKTMQEDALRAMFNAERKVAVKEQKKQEKALQKAKSKV